MRCDEGREHTDGEHEERRACHAKQNGEARSEIQQARVHSRAASKRVVVISYCQCATEKTDIYNEWEYNLWAYMGPHSWR